MILEVGLGIAGAIGALWVAGKVVDHWLPRLQELEAARIQHRANLVKLQHMENQARLRAVRQFVPDKNGQLGVAYDATTGRYTNLITQTVFDQWRVHQFDPMREKLASMERALLSARGVSGGSEIVQELPDSTLPKLPTQISIQDVLGTRTPTLDTLTIGITLDEEGNRVPMTRSLYDLMHLLAIGITGSGKSTWLLSFLAQIEMCAQPIEVLLIDVHGSAFNLCADWSKLRYPVARDNDQAKALLEAVRVESERRSTLYEAVPLAEDLASYNEHADESLDPWLIIIDEGTLMLADKSISDYVAASVQGTRQYGLYVFMTGQTGNAEVVKSPIRANFPTRICYTTEAPSMRAALGETPPGELEEIPGRGWARLKGKRTPVKMQAPYIRRDKFFGMIEHSGPRMPMPEIEQEQNTQADRAQRILELSEQGESDTAIAREVFGYANGYSIDKVRNVTTTTISQTE